MGNILAKIGDWVKVRRGALWGLAMAALAAWAAYNLGLIAANRGIRPAQETAVFRVREGIVPRSSGTEQGSPKTTPDHSDPRVVVSKASKAKKYHFSWCAGAKQIKEANRLWFSSSAEAEASGYTLAANCSR